MCKTKQFESNSKKKIKMQKQPGHQRFTKNMEQLLNSTCTSYALLSANDMPIGSNDSFDKRPECLYT